MTISTELYVLIYFIIGLFVDFYEFEFIYKKQIDDLKKINKDIEYGMYAMLATVHMFIWPIIILLHCFKKLKNKISDIH